MMTMMKKGLRYGAILLAAVFFAGCSLLKVSVSTGDPLAKEEVRARTLTRGFYYDMAGDVVRTADSIIALTPDRRVKLAAVRWKIHATRAGVAAAMQGLPDVAMADMWILCRRMSEAFAATPDSLLFGEGSDMARELAVDLDRRVARLARQTLPSERYELMAGFVERYVREHPAGAEVGAESTTLAWIELLESHGHSHALSTGSIAEVLADINDRVSGQTQQLSNTIGWSKDMLEIELQEDSVRAGLLARVDSLERGFGRLVVVAEHLPEISDRMLTELNAQAAQLIGEMNASVDNLFFGVDRQRAELQRYVSLERQALVEQVRAAGDDMVQGVLDAVPGLVGEVLLYLVLALVVLIGGPFALGFWLGGVRQRLKAARAQKEVHK